MDKLSPRDSVDLLFAREICCPIVSNIHVKVGHTVAGDVMLFFFFLLLEMRDLDKLKSKLELNIIMKKRMALIPVNILSTVWSVIIAKMY